MRGTINRIEGGVVFLDLDGYKEEICLPLRACSKITYLFFGTFKLEKFCSSTLHEIVFL